MGKSAFFDLLKQEIARIDSVKTTKRNERVIEGFTSDPSPKGIINGKEISIFNSNDYLGLRHNPKVKRAEAEASEKFGAGPGAVRFISGSLKIHRDLERQVASFHNRDDAMIFSSAFAANMAVMFCLIVGQSKDSVVDNDVYVLSDALNHRSIIDGIRIANHPKEKRGIFGHMNPADLAKQLEVGKAGNKRALVVTDGVFSMLGEFQKLKAIKEVVDKYDKEYEMGVLLVVDDAHGVGACGNTGRGVEEMEGVQSDVLVGTFGKAFGADGGYVVANQTIIDYLRESAATYIYSNPFSPGTAGAALKSLELMDEPEGKELLSKVAENTNYFKEQMKSAGFEFAADSSHPIQPVLIGDPVKTRELVDFLFSKNFLVTNISYPVVPKGADEIRIQLSSSHTKEDIDSLIQGFISSKKRVVV
jgi:glycine C-acetyltransferase